MELILSVIAIIVSVISIVAAVICAVVTYYQNRRINNINMKSRYFEKIFDDYLITKIPETRKYLRFEKGHLVDGEKMGDVLNDMLNDALYFKYDNKTFYNELKKCIQLLEDYIMDSGNKTYDNEEQAGVFAEIHKMVGEIYGCVNTYYIGK